MMNLPGGCEVRCPTINDSVAVLAFIQEKEWAEYGEVNTTERSLRNAWQALSFNLSTDAWVVTTQGGQIIGYARVWHYQHLHIYLQLVVLPASSEVEIKIFLLSMAEQRAQEYAALALTGTSVALRMVTTDKNYTDQNVLAQTGYHKLRSR